MKFIWFPQLLIIFGFLILGYSTATIFHLPLPGSVVGMLLLFVSLITGIMKLEWIEKVSSFQLKHLTLLFIPPIAGLFISSGFIEILKWNILIILIISSIFCLLGTAFAVEWFEKRRDMK
ncbi:CidA/LrgA family protein [Virgibacillus ndiopensis]|uniref:CidA/LrgA family protein n=1 Tax=Virgibacillus ndiopensis TaxID=2004408 RepID=UPI000C088B65|nr:CidA/LrgA family protein [Virgibacillus ndiopensis]